MVFATNNEGKLRELKEIFGDKNIISLKEIGVNINVVEDQNSFYGNARKKAIEVFNLVKIPVIADDSGLCINALNGFPGVMTHRFLGANKTDKEINDALIKACSNLKDRSAKVVCCLVYYDGVNEVVETGEINGNITLEARGINGFGFDPIFELKDGRTLAELDSDTKNICSARYLAAKKLKKSLNKLDKNLKKKL